MSVGKPTARERAEDFAKNWDLTTEQVNDLTEYFEAAGKDAREPLLMALVGALPKLMHEHSCAGAGPDGFPTMKPCDCVRSRVQTALQPWIKELHALHGLPPKQG